MRSHGCWRPDAAAGWRRAARRQGRCKSCWQRCWRCTMLWEITGRRLRKAGVRAPGTMMSTKSFQTCACRLSWWLPTSASPGPSTTRSSCQCRRRSSGRKGVRQLSCRPPIPPVARLPACPLACLPVCLPAFPVVNLCSVTGLGVGPVCHVECQHRHVECQHRALLVVVAAGQRRMQTRVRVHAWPCLPVLQACCTA